MPKTTNTRTVLPDSLCKHTQKCPSADSPDREAAKVVAAHPEQGWSLLCNAVLLFEDTGELLPDGPGNAPSLRLADAAALIEGTVRSGKTNLAAFHAARAARSNGAPWPV